MYWSQHLEAQHELAPESVAVEKRPLVFEVSVDDLRNLNFLVCHSPQKDVPIDCAHSSVYWPDGREPHKNVKRNLRRHMARRLHRVHGELDRPAPGA
jgi:hypothetical protein